MQNIQQELRETFEQLQNLNKIQEHLDHIDKRLNAAYEVHAKLEKQYEKEKKDFELMEKLSMRSLFYQVLGDRNAQLEKERQEYLEAAMSYNEVVKNIELLQFERNLLVGKVKGGQELRDKLETLIEKKEKVLLSMDSVDGIRLVKITRSISRASRDLDAVNELIDLGEEALIVLRKMIKHLVNARDWGEWDIWESQRHGYFSGYSDVDRARDLAYKAKMILTKFEDRLRSYFPEKRIHLSLNVDLFSRFTEIFFDNLLSDWIIQSKIRNSLNSVRIAHDKVLLIRKTLDKEKLEKERTIDDFEKQRRELIISA